MTFPPEVHCPKFSPYRVLLGVFFVTSFANIYFAKSWFFLPTKFPQLSKRIDSKLTASFNVIVCFSLGTKSLTIYGRFRFKKVKEALKNFTLILLLSLKLLRVVLALLTSILQTLNIHLSQGFSKFFSIATHLKYFPFSATLKCYNLQWIYGKRTILVYFGNP